MKQWQKLTDMIGFGDIVDEMTKKYKGTILGVNQGTKCIYGRYNQYSPDEKVFRFRDKHNNNFHLVSDTDTEVFIPSPEKGLYNTMENGAVYFMRNPMRQWKRGLNDQNTLLYAVNKHCTYGAINVFDSFWDYVVEPLPDLAIKDALKIASNDGSAAINRTYGVVAHPSKDSGFVLLHHLYQIGEINDEKITVLNPIFRQEIMDTKNDWCPNHYVE